MTVGGCKTTGLKVPSVEMVCVCACVRAHVRVRALTSQKFWESDFPKEWFLNRPEGLVRWLSGFECGLFFQSTQVQCPAPSWCLTTIYNSNSKGPSALLCSPWALYIHMVQGIYAGKMPPQIKIRSFFFFFYKKKKRERRKPNVNPLWYLSENLLMKSNMEKNTWFPIKMTHQQPARAPLCCWESGLMFC